MMLRRSGWTALCAATLICAAATAAEFHHMHLTATDQAEAAQWYAKHMGGQLNDFGPMKTAVFDGVAFVFYQKEAGFGGSVGSAIDHIGFSWPDLDAKMEEFRAAGIKIVAEPVQMGAIKFGFIEDPWGTKIEVMQDPETLGFHHVHLHSPDPDATLQWYSKTFGGEITRYGGILPAIKYGNMWLICQRTNKELAPTIGRAADHLGFSVENLDGFAATAKADGVNFSVEPRDFMSLRISFVDGPQGVRIEVVQPNAGGQ